MEGAGLSRADHHTPHSVQIWTGYMELYERESTAVIVSYWEKFVSNMVNMLGNFAIGETVSYSCSPSSLFSLSFTSSPSFSLYSPFSSFVRCLFSSALYIVTVVPLYVFQCLFMYTFLSSSFSSFSSSSSSSSSIPPSIAERWFTLLMTG